MRRSSRIAIGLGVLALLGLVSNAVDAQTAPAPVVAPTAIPPANPADVQSVDAIVAALYDVISGPGEKVRDWNRFYSLFNVGGRLIATGTRANGTKFIRVLTPVEYVTASAPAMARAGFFERETGRTGETYNGISQVFSAYESRNAPTDANPIESGINSIQLYNDGTRWYIVSVFWAGASNGAPVPQRYLGKHDTGG
jgi:hypothetical protein